MSTILRFFFLFMLFVPCAAGISNAESAFNASKLDSCISQFHGIYNIDTMEQLQELTKSPGFKQEMQKCFKTEETAGLNSQEPGAAGGSQYFLCLIHCDLAYDKNTWQYTLCVMMCIPSAIN